MAPDATTLNINGHAFRLSARSKRLTVPIKRERAALLLEMTVSEQGIPIPFAARVNRT